MKFAVHHFKKDDIVNARVVESLSDEEFIVNFYGDLLRVANLSKVPLQPGQLIQLKVTTIDPLGFQLVSPKRKDSINVSV